MNHQIVSQLTELYQHHRDEGDTFRAMAYARAAKIIKQLPFQVESADQLTDIKGIGPKIATKIDQLLEKGTIEQLQQIKARQDPRRVKALREFQTIHGIGPAVAAKLYDVHGIGTVKKLARSSAKNPELLTNAQKIGLRYRDAFAHRIPREFIKTYQFSIAYCLDQAFGHTFKMQTAGSFRRGKADSGDMDVMLCTDQFTLPEAIEVLIANGLVIDVLALDQKKFMGVAVCPGVKDSTPFRLDIFMVSKPNWWVALVTHTGPKDLNTMMRTTAATMGMKLSDQGLFRGSEKIPIKSEADLFKKLNMKPIPPTDR